MISDDGWPNMDHGLHGEAIERVRRASVNDIDEQ
jgi:hypothetical protein